MKIIRNGVEIELTPREMFDAYKEVEKKDIIESLKDQYFGYDDSLEEDEVSVSEWEQAYEDFVHARDHNDVYWSYFWDMIDESVVNNIPFKRDNIEEESTNTSMEIE